MTPDIAAEPLPLPETQIPSTAGMTTKVVKGSIWTLGGQVVPLFATLVTTPFVIRFLGTESYGVLLLVGLIPNYFAFADFGMGMASTKFGSEAYGRGDRRREGEVVRTSALIAFACSTIFAIPLIIFAGNIVTALNVPEHLIADATLALRLTSISFVLGILSNVFNTPQLARLRMDLNAIINATGRVVLSFGTVAVLFLGGGIVGAAAFMVGVAAVGLTAHLLVSRSLLSELFDFSINTSLLRPILWFGGGLLIAGIATIVLANAEKLLLTAVLSVQSLAYYSVAFTFASMATMFSWAMVQSLIPAFSQLLKPETKEQFNVLFSRSLRLTIISLLPILTIMFVFAGPFFTYWAGEDFGRESTLPFYILLAGLLFNIIAYVPYSALLAAGHSQTIAKLAWIELLPYVVLAAALISTFGIAGAAAAWSLRVAVDSIVLSFLARRIVGAPFYLRSRLYPFAIALAILSIPVLFVLVFGNYSIWLLFVTAICCGGYLFWVWKWIVDNDERVWIADRVNAAIHLRGLAV